MSASHVRTSEGACSRSSADRHSRTSSGMLSVAVMGSDGDVAEHRTKLGRGIHAEEDHYVHEILFEQGAFLAVDTLGLRALAVTLAGAADRLPAEAKLPSEVPELCGSDREPEVRTDRCGQRLVAGTPSLHVFLVVANPIHDLEGRQ